MTRRFPFPLPGGVARAGAIALGAALVALWTAAHGAQAAEPGAGGPAEASHAEDVPGGNWRTRDVLDAQRKAPGTPPPASGAESGVITDNYLKSVGKGGAGADLSSGDGMAPLNQR